jgi:hypothetical protein
VDTSVDTSTPGPDRPDGFDRSDGPDAGQPLASRIEQGLARLDEADLAEHPAEYEEMDEAIRAELGALEQLSADPDG